MEPLRVGGRLPVRVEQILNGDTLVVSLRCGERSFTGLLLDCSRGSGLFGLPLSLPKHDAPLSDSCSRWDPHEGKGDGGGPETVIPPPPPASEKAPATAAGLDPAPPLVPPVPAGSAPPFPPYFEGAPFPQPLWLRHTYNQWVPQPPPRTIKRTKRRLSRNRDPGRLIMSTIRLRPRRVLCEKCKNTLNPEESLPSQPSAKPRRRPSAPDKEPKKLEEPDSELRRTKREKSGELVPRSPVIKISYSTPQGKGEVVKIPSRVHGSLEPFRPRQGPHDGQDLEAPGQPASIPKLKLTRPVPSGDAPPPKIRLKPHRLPPAGGSSSGRSVSVYKAELIDELGESGSSAAFYTEESSRRQRLAELSSGSSGDEDGFGGFPPAKDGRDGLAFLVNYKRKADSSSLSVCSNESLDESSSDTASPDGCDFLPGEDVSVSSSSREERKTVPPLTVRLHTQSVSRCVTEDGSTVSVGDVVWGKIPGCPWWPARILDLSLSQKEDGAPCWREARVSWFGSPTTSSLSVSKLSPFSEFFKLRFNRKKKGVYRKAITEAAKAAPRLSPEIRELLSQFET
ncbi:PWWP domain-containing protein 2B [Macrotis lagotis]|uniref:PWWP domain-containing protein 2B n=1 Tax=Macrotis lagotis TaxID=92651 RepID=UPI003D69EE43